MNEVFLDWSSMYFEAPQKGIIRVGYSRDHRPDRPQVTVGLSVDKESGMPIGLTINPGDMLDVTHFNDTFTQILPLLPKDAMLVFDNGAYSMDNAKTIDSHNLGFITRMQLNASDDVFVRTHDDGWLCVDTDVSYMHVRSNLGRTKYIFHNLRLWNDILVRYRSKAERDWDEMQIIRKNIDSGKRQRKKYRNGNCFVDTKLCYRFPLDGRSREESINEAVNGMITGREGLFVLMSNRPLTALEMLDSYRSRNSVETAFHDLKHGIDWRLARCTSEDAIRGRILISFLALFSMSTIRFLYPEFRTKTAESLSEELSSFSLTIIVGDDRKKRRIFSNFNRIVRRLWGRSGPDPVPAAPGQTAIRRFG